MLFRIVPQVMLVVVLSAASATIGWCSRADKGDSAYGQNTAPCIAPSGPSTPLTASGITATCFSPGSGINNATLFQLTAAAGPPKTINVFVSFPGAASASLDFGLITCDGSGTIPCVNKDSSLGSINPVNFGSDTPSFAANTPLFTFTNFTGQLDFYIAQAAVITNVTTGAVSLVPEPRFLGLFGMLCLPLLSLARRAALKSLC